MGADLESNVKREEDHGSDPFGKENLMRLVAVAAQIVVVAILFKAVRLESEGFRQLLTYAAIAFPIHHLLPLRFRLPFFVVLSVFGVFSVIGVPSALWLLGLGLVLIGVCHVPAPVGIRLGLVALVASVFAFFRGGWVEAPWPSSIWPILGAMFMFRMIVYLYDLVHGSAPFNLWRSLAYFFMIPNICFPLFPVVDYQTFCRTYYNEDPFKIYQTGVKWMIRGAIQLVLYRFIYQFMIVGSAEIEGAGGFFQQMVCTYLLYLQVSGIFHTIIGFLHLFGFNLPETNHHWVLASSFTDFWRRINIYWKDFIMKVFFYPLYFRLRKLGNTRGMILATLIAFFATWALHAYQWFWIRGSALFNLPDIIFWVVLGVLVTVSVWNESRPKRKLVPKTASDSAKLATLLAAKTVATFLTITFVWSLWTSDSVAEWQATLLQWGNWSLEGVLKIVLSLGALAAVAIIVGRDQWQVGGAAKTRASKARPFNFWRGATINVATGCFVTLMAVAEVQSHMNPQLVAVLNAIEMPGLNTRDAARMQRGYYEDLIQVDRFNTELQAMYNKRPRDYFAQWANAMKVQRDDFLGNELKPNVSITYEGALYTTNQWGMRDRPYTKEKPEGVRRIGLIGSSHIMGWGIGDADVCDNVAEDRLNAEGYHYQLMNFSVYGYNSIQMGMALEERMREFDLDDVFMFCHRTERQWIVSHLVECVKSGREIDDPRIREIVAKAQVSPDMNEAVMKIRLTNYGSELLRWSLTRVTEACRAKGVRSVWVFMPDVGRASSSNRDIEEIVELAKEAGFDLVLDFSDAYKGYTYKALAISDYDDHSNALAHRLLAERIYETVKNYDAMFSGAATAPDESAGPTAP